MKRKTSLKDIAKAAGVSTALVSYVLNNKEEEARVNKTTAKEIRKIAHDLEYQPNWVAKSLKSGKSLSIGLIVADISNPFFAHLARLIENESKEKNYTVLFGSSDEDPDQSDKLIRSLAQRQIDGFIVAPTEKSKDQLKFLEDLNIPYVLIDRYFEDLESSYVIINNFKSTYKATEHLMKKGNERIAYIKYDNQLQHTVDRFEGYLRALKDYGKSKTKNPVCEVGYKNETDFSKKFKAVLKDHVDAIMFSTNTLSIRGLKLCKQMKIQIPKDIAVFCFDQSESYDLFYYPVNYVYQPLDKIAREAVKSLIDQIEGKQEKPRKIILEPEIIIND